MTNPEGKQALGGIELKAKRIAEIIQTVNSLDLERDRLNKEVLAYFESMIGQKVTFGGFAERQDIDGDWDDLNHTLPLDDYEVVGTLHSVGDEDFEEYLVLVKVDYFGEQITAIIDIRYLVFDPIDS